MLDRTTKRLVAVVLVAYTLVAWDGRDSVLREHFPVFSFDLFSTLPERESSRPDVWLHQVGDQVFDEPVPLIGSGHLRGRGGSVSGFANQLRAALGGDGDPQPFIDALLANHLPVDVVEWSLRLDVTDLYVAPGVAIESHELRRFVVNGDFRDRFEITDDGVQMVGHPLLPWRDDAGGRLEAVEALADGRVRLAGWAAHGASTRLPDRVLVVDDARNILVVGGVGLRRGDVVEALGSRAVQWAGFSIGLEPDLVGVGASLPTVIALFEDGARIVEPSNALLEERSNS